MYRVIAILGGALILSACSSMPDWMKPAPTMDAVRFESDPPGAEARTSNGQTCQTPCELALPVETPLTVTFTLNGYQPVTENIEPIMTTGIAPQMRPNPVTVALTPALPPPKPVKRPMKNKKDAGVEEEAGRHEAGRGSDAGCNACSCAGARAEPGADIASTGGNAAAGTLAGRPQAFVNFIPLQQATQASMRIVSPA